MKLGFIGAGNMGGAIIKGLIKSGKIPAENINVTEKDTNILHTLAKEQGIKPCAGYKELTDNSDIVFMAVKPVVFPSVIDDIKEYIREKRPLLISMAAGITTESIEDMLGFKTPIVRMMPNINAEILMSATALCKNDAADDKDMDTARDILNAIGMTAIIDEGMFAVFSAIAGCSPAYVYLFIDSLAKGAQKMGMNKKQALEIAAAAVSGSAAMFTRSGAHPWELIDKVCSPGGTTIEGVCTLEEYKFSSAVVKAVENSVLKDRALNKK